jgi:hypothetical protein
METYSAFCKVGNKTIISLGHRISMYPKGPTTGHLDTGFLNLISSFFRFLGLNLSSSKCREIVPKFQVYYQKVNVVGPRDSLDVAEKRNLPSLPEFKSLIVQHVATRYTDCPIMAPYIRIGNNTLFLSHIYTQG